MVPAACPLDPLPMHESEESRGFLRKLTEALRHKLTSEDITYTRAAQEIGDCNPSDVQRWSRGGSMRIDKAERMIEWLGGDLERALASTSAPVGAIAIRGSVHAGTVRSFSSKALRSDQAVVSPDPTLELSQRWRMTEGDPFAIKVSDASLGSSYPPGTVIVLRKPKEGTQLPDGTEILVQVGGDRFFREIRRIERPTPIVLARSFVRDGEDFILSGNSDAEIIGVELRRIFSHV